MFNMFIINFITPLLLLAILLILKKMIRTETDPNRKMMIVVGMLTGGMIGTLIMALNRVYLHFDYWSFDPFVLLLSRNMTILLFITISAFIAYFVLTSIDQLSKKNQKYISSGIYAFLFVLLIYLAYYRLALETVAVFIITGFLVGIGLKKLVDSGV